MRWETQMVADCRLPIADCRLKSEIGNRKWAIPWAALAAALCVCSGCVEIEQEIHMNHDGSGKIVERLALSPRGVRLTEAAASSVNSPGAGGPIAALFTEEGFQKRLNAMGEVTVESRQEAKLPDGRRQLQNVYTFKDVNKVRLWTLPTLGYLKGGKNSRAAADGALRLKFVPEYESWGKVYRETVTVEAPVLPDLRGQELLSPAERQKFLRVLPIFLDMTRDLRVSIVLVAPIEDFEEPQDMLKHLTAERNRVTLFRIQGDGVVQAPEGVLQLMMNEVTGVPASVPGSLLPWPIEYGGRLVRFMKATPAKKDEK
ncbi:MAG: hypothetical protein FJ290_11060 [Planctomycetes bacterium]|nr:hypothetical protein [Planctomycetota bacterium]